MPFSYKELEIDWSIIYALSDSFPESIFIGCAFLYPLISSLYRFLSSRAFDSYGSFSSAASKLINAQLKYTCVST